MKQITLVRTGFLAALAVLATIVFMSHWFMSQWALADLREEYTFGIVQKMDRLLLSLAEVRKSQRDYAKDGNPEQLAAFREAGLQVERELEGLESLAGRHPRLRQWLDRIEPLVREKLFSRRRAVALEGGREDGQGSGVSSDRIRREVIAVQNEAIQEQRDLAARQSADLRTVQKLLIADCIIIFLQICLVYRLYRRDLDRRLESERRLTEDRDELERQVEKRTADLEEANRELQLERRLAEQARRDLGAHQDAVREEERLALSRELHDEIGQNLTALKLDLSWMERRLAPDQGEVALRLGELLLRLDGLIDTTRHISAELRPPMLDNVGLAAAMEWQASDFGRRSGIECDIMLDDAFEVAQPTATNLLRIFQEALTNIARHARATQLFISLRKRGDQLVLEISDNGRGISATERDAATAYGIMGMQERARLCGGVLSIDGTPGEGTTLRLTVPVGGKEGQ
jgi:signal transduction histidine kinase